LARQTAALQAISFVAARERLSPAIAAPSGGLRVNRGLQ